jgi:hypothetical protein
MTLPVKSYLQGSSLLDNEDYILREQSKSTMSGRIELFMKENEHIQRINKWRLCCGTFIEHVWTQTIVSILIIANVAILGLVTFDLADSAIDVLDKIDLALLIIFTIELTMQFIYRGYTLFLDGILLFDLLMTVISWVALSSSVHALKSLRILRAFRLGTRFKTIRTLVMALLGTLPQLSATFGLLALVIYTFAVLFTGMFGDLDLSEPYFDGLFGSMLTLFQMMTGDFTGIMRECMAYYWWAWIPIVFFILITGFVIFNVIVAVVCDGVATMAAQRREDEMKDTEETASVASRGSSNSEFIFIAKKLASIETRLKQKQVLKVVRRGRSKKCRPQFDVKQRQHSLDPNGYHVKEIHNEEKVQRPLRHYEQANIGTKQRNFAQ